MEIKNLNTKMLNAYKSVGGNAAKGGKPSAGDAGKKSDNFDKLEFNLGQALSSAKAGVAAEVAMGLSGARLEALQQAYQDDKLPISPEQIAESIVG